MAARREDRFPGVKHEQREAAKLLASKRVTCYTMKSSDIRFLF